MNVATNFASYLPLHAVMHRAGTTAISAFVQATDSAASSTSGPPCLMQIEPWHTEIFGTSTLTDALVAKSAQRSGESAERTADVVGCMRHNQRGVEELPNPARGNIAVPVPPPVLGWGYGTM